MQLQIVYFRVKGFWALLFPFIFTGIYLSSSDTVFFYWGGKCRLFKSHLFHKKFNLLTSQELYVDYDVYVQIAQRCLTETTDKNKWGIRGADLVYKVITEGLVNDKDYKHLKLLSSTEIKALNAKKLLNYFWSVIDGINVEPLA